MPTYTAEYIFDGSQILRNAFVSVNEKGVIQELGQAQKDIYVDRHFDGLIMPGFINTHCHLELSHLKGKVDTGTGLLPFLSSVVQFREVDQKEIDQAISFNDQFMWEHGIQACGDISNKADTFSVKEASPIRYYTFIEMFDLLQGHLTDMFFGQYKEVFKNCKETGGNKFSASPHAPYSVTTGMFDKINSLNSGHRTISIHNQETPHENAYFLDKTGDFSAFFKRLGFDDASFSPTQKESIYYAMSHMDEKHKTLFVHNTTTSAKNITDADKWGSCFWATCPNANLYIENSLPDYQTFIDCDAKVTIGTDSLSSNWQLSVLDELKTIQRYNSFIPVETLLKWSTINGAEALSFDDTLGSFSKGKTPGIIQLENFDGTSLQECEVKRIK